MHRVDLSSVTDYCSHNISYGSPGMGKSVTTKKLVEYFFSKKVKILDLYDEFRLENCFYAFPNQSISMYKRFFEKIVSWGVVPFDAVVRIKRGEISAQDVVKWEPKGFPTECFIPAVASKSLPVNLPSIFKPYRIVYNELTAQEFRILLGYLSDEQTNIIKEALHRARSYKEFVALFKDKKFLYHCLNECDYKGLKDLVRRIDEIHVLGLLCEADDPFALDLDGIMRDYKTISSFSFFNIDDENLMYLLIAFILRKVFSLRKAAANKVSQYCEMALVLREIQNVAPARGQGMLFAYEGQKSSTYTLYRIMREPRDIKIRVVADSQSPDSIAKHIRKNFGSVNIFQLDLIQLNAVTELLYLDGRTYIGVQNSEIGIHAKKIKPQSKFSGDRTGVHFAVIMPPPLSWCKNPDDKFFEVWRRFANTYIRPGIRKNPSILSADLFDFRSIEAENRPELPSKSAERSMRQKANIVLKAAQEGGMKEFSAASLLELAVIKSLSDLVPDAWNRKDIDRLLSWLRDKGELDYNEQVKKYSIKVLPAGKA